MTCTKNKKNKTKQKKEIFRKIYEEDRFIERKNKKQKKKKNKKKKERERESLRERKK